MVRSTCNLSSCYKNVNVWSYIAQYPVRRTAQNVYTSPPGRHAHSDTNSTYLGLISKRSYFNINGFVLKENMYSFIQLDYFFDKLDYFHVIILLMT